MMHQPYQGMPAQGHHQNEQHAKDMHNMCTQYHLHFIQIQLMDGSSHDGIIEEVDNEGVTLLMPEAEEGAQQPYYGQHGHESHHELHAQQGTQMQDSPQHFGYGYPGYGYPGFGPGPGYGYGYGIPRRFRRFRRRRYPFFGIRRLFFPFFF
ncbi:hypothetical protein [Salipaludibacillus daqingensis]|uniref:hypothetical protein n=1 Tax=Salipaludibacillus daqingensis TaxID=3041001 RepID=UPI0024735E65|nr:hypothetical protein [Salipaludibacillus daqingensis]